MDRRSWLGIVTLLALGLLYLQLPELYSHQTANNGRLDVSAWNFDTQGPIQLDQNWNNWQSQPDNEPDGKNAANSYRASLYKLSLGNLSVYRHAEDLALLLQPTCLQTTTTTWQRTHAGEADDMPLSFSLYKPVLIGLTPYLSGQNHQLSIQSHHFSNNQTEPCLDIFIGSTQQLSQLMSWVLIIEIAPIALLAILLLTLIGRAFIQTYYQDLAWFGLCVASLLIYALSKSNYLIFTLSHSLGQFDFCNARYSALGLIGAAFFGGIYCLKYIDFKTPLRKCTPWTLAGCLTAIPLLFAFDADNRSWLVPLILALIITHEVLVVTIMGLAMAKRPSMDTLYKVLLTISIALALINIVTEWIDDYHLRFIIVALVLVIRMNLTLFPSTETKLAPHEERNLRAEIDRHTATLNEKNQELEIAQKALEIANMELQALSVTDGLTNAYNRLYFDRQFLLEWQRARREQENLSLLLVDIDHFKELNDRHGHLAGDEGLKLVTKHLQQTFQRGNDFVCRYGGEEFVILLPNTSADQAAIHADKAREIIATTPLVYEGKSISMTISTGVGGVIPQDEHQPLDLLHATDQALYWVKRHGRNGVKIADTVLADNAVTAESI
jgi:diguanylate cyclase (GGDEF)-like protein